MGILDDAIRDHLELKRRRGADPAEVERAEREALGPVRRQPEAGDDLDYADELAAGGPVEVGDDPDRQGDDPGYYDREPVAYEDEFEDQDWHEPASGAVAHDPVQSPRDAEPFAEPAARDHAPVPAPPDPVSPPTEAADLERGDEPDPGVDTKPHETVRPERPAGGEVSGPGGRRIGEETAEYDVESEHPAGDEREDVLEETPEFLQDTPDHDRLWFEQRPPRDFNFDG